MQTIATVIGFVVVAVVAVVVFVVVVVGVVSFTVVLFLCSHTHTHTQCQCINVHMNMRCCCSSFDSNIFVQNLNVPANRGVGFFSVLFPFYMLVCYNQKRFCSFFALPLTVIRLVNFQFTACHNKQPNRSNM